LLGICRGQQILAVALGGSLLQHVPALPGALSHADGEADSTHAVSVLQGSRLAAILDAVLMPDSTAVVNSHHHQAVDRLSVPAGWRVAAATPDGVVEAIEPIDDGVNALAVQWHPERHFVEDGSLSSVSRRLLSFAWASSP
jgi:putative glutamine amidotransferase